MNKVILYGPLPPLYSYGGPVRSLNALRTSLKKELDLICISPNYHLNRSKIEISSTKDILYTSYPFLELIKKCLKNKNTTVWYNSFFELGFIFFLILSKLGLCQIILSPRGQLAKEAIYSSNPKIKYLFIRIARFFYSRKVFFHATDENEKADIETFFNKSRIEVIPNISNQAYLENNSFKSNFVFFSRISKKKGLFELLSTIDFANEDINLDVYGFKEDSNYWQSCEEIINRNKNISYCGELENGDLTPLSNRYTFFILPTYNENYGHVIFEALSLGMIPILSKGTTPFDQEINKIVGLNFNHNSKESILFSIKKAKSLSEKDISNMRDNLKTYFLKLVHKQRTYEKQYINFVKAIIKN